MKNYIIILFAAICLIGCDSSEDPEVIADKPTITSATFYCAYSGSNSSQAVNVVISATAGSIRRLSFFSKTGTELYYVDNPESGMHTLYNHVGDCQIGVSPGIYYFVFTRKDGSKVVTEPYPKP